MNEPTLEYPAGDDALLQAETEVRHLKNTVSALREEMEAMQFENQQNVQRAIAAHRNQRIDPQPTCRLQQLVGPIFFRPIAIGGEQRPTKRIPPIRRAENCASYVRDAADTLTIERDDPSVAQQTAKPTPNTQDLPTPIECREDHGANDRVQTRSIASTGRDRDPHVIPGVAP